MTIPNVPQLRSSDKTDSVRENTIHIERISPQNFHAILVDSFGRLITETFANNALGEESLNRFICNCPGDYFVTDERSHSIIKKYYVREARK